MSFLGLDLGTSGLRALLIDADGQPIGAVERGYDVSAPHPGWSEQSPQLWVDALDSAVAELRERFPAFADLRGVGVAGHMHGATLLDADGTVLRPCILWNDTRAASEAAVLDATPGVRDVSGNIVFPGFTAPKLDWLRAHEPEIHARVAKVLLPAGFLNHYLTGEAVADVSDSAGTAWLDVARRDWSADLLTAGHMRPDQMPRLVEGSAPAGLLRQDLAQRWGLSQPVTVAGGAGDNAAAACGIGAVRDGQGFVSLGTSGVVLVARDACRPAPDTAVHTFCHAVPGAWVQMGVMLSATDSLNWLGRITGARPADLTAELGEALLPPGPERFLPYLSGERTPHNDAAIRGSLTGLSIRTTRADMTRAVLAGVAFGLRDSLEALRATGTRVPALMAIGGGSKSRLWLRMIATVLNTPLHLPAQGEFGAALGAARLGMVAATGADPMAMMTPPKVQDVIAPDADLVPAYEDAYQQFRATYPAIRAVQ
jgi:xylulokinase